MKAVFAAVLVVAMVASQAYAECNLENSGTTVSFPAGTYGSVGACVSLESSCLRPGGGSCPAEPCCSGGGEGDLVHYATQNSVTCTTTVVSPANYSAFPGSYNIDTENSVLIEFYPAPTFVGTVVLNCISQTEGNDYSLGTPPQQIGNPAQYTFVVQAIPCANPCYGTCNAALGCVCNPGYSGEHCEIGAAALATTTSLALIMLFAVGVLFLVL